MPSLLPVRAARTCFTGFALVKVTLQELRVEYFHLDYRDGLSPAYTAYVRSGEFKMPVV